MRKYCILDTSVLVHDPNSLTNFPGNTVIIPIIVLNELDKLKTFANEVGKNARICIKNLDDLCKQGAIHKGIKLQNNSTIKIDASQQLEKFGPDSYGDNQILACAYTYLVKNSKKTNIPETILVSKDINLRVRASALNIKSQDYQKGNNNINELYQGFRTITNGNIGRLLSKKELEVKLYKELQDLEPNECVYLESETGEGLALGRRVGDKLISIKNKKPWGLDLRNKEQAFAVDMLCDPRIPLVSLIGKAGTGKSLCAVAAGLEMVLEQKKYSKFIIYRPIQPVGNDIGYLPGSMEEKLAPWMQAISDSFEFLFESKNGNRWKTILGRYLDEGAIQMEAITYVRGRSIHNAFILIDEAQNLSKEEVKTILTRAGTGSKIVLTGDIEQIDNSHLDAVNNGLTYIVDKFKNIDLAGHITFTKGERSALASKASEIL